MVVSPRKPAGSSSPAKSFLDKLVQVAQVVSLLALPLIVAYGGWRIQSTTSAETIHAKYVELALGILREKPSPETLEVRGWATKTLALYSPVAFSPSELENLRTGRTRLPLVIPSNASTVPIGYRTRPDGKIEFYNGSTGQFQDSPPNSSSVATEMQPDGTIKYFNPATKQFESPVRVVLPSPSPNPASPSSSKSPPPNPREPTNFHVEQHPSPSPVTSAVKPSPTN